MVMTIVEAVTMNYQLMVIMVTNIDDSDDNGNNI